VFIGSGLEFLTGECVLARLGIARRLGDARGGAGARENIRRPERAVGFRAPARPRFYASA
jgi:hypothetical protein